MSNLTSTTIMAALMAAIAAAQDASPVPSGTETHTPTPTAYVPSITQQFQTKIKRQPQEDTISVPATCFTYVTTTTNAFGGECEPLPTQTATVDCGGCGLVTVTETKDIGLGVCPTETAKTSMVCATNAAKQ